jgi:branched-chain amino acid transport system ATP-binding protein
MTSPRSERMLEATGVSVSFGAVKAVDGVDLWVAPGEVLGIIGPNGSGKSTFLNAVTGVVTAKGSVRIAGTPVHTGRPEAVARLGLRRTFQTPQVHDGLTCLENVLVGLPDRTLRSVGAAWCRRPSMWRLERARWEAAREALNFVGIEHLAQRQAGVLSYGQRRMLEIARARAGEPRVLLMDEPAAGLNQVETEELLVLLRKVVTDSSSLVVVEHKMDFLQSLCSRLVVLELGRVIAQGPPAEVLRDQKVIDAYLGTVADHA